MHEESGSSETKMSYGQYVWHVKKRHGSHVGPLVDVTTNIYPEEGPNTLKIGSSSYGLPCFGPQTPNMNSIDPYVVLDAMSSCDQPCGTRRQIRRPNCVADASGRLSEGRGSTRLLGEGQTNTLGRSVTIAKERGEIAR